MKLFYWSVGGLLGLGGLIWAISSFWPEPRKDVVQAVYVNGEEMVTACYQFTTYELLGFERQQFTEVPPVDAHTSQTSNPKDCLGSQESIIFDCTGVDFQACQEVLKIGIEKQGPQDVDALVEQQKAAPSE